MQVRKVCGCQRRRAVLGPAALHVRQEGPLHVRAYSPHFLQPRLVVGVGPHSDGPPYRGYGWMWGVPKRTYTSQPCDGHLTAWGSQEPWGISAARGCYKPMASHSHWAIDLQRHQWSVSKTPCHLGILTWSRWRCGGGWGLRSS